MTSYRGELFDNGLVYRHVSSVHTPGKFADLHTHGQFELLYVVSGDLTHVVEGRMYPLKKGDLALIRPSKYHFLQLNSDQPYERFNILFDPQLNGIRTADLIPETAEVLTLSDNPMATDMFRKLELYHSSTDRATFAMSLKLILNELFINLSIFSGAQNKQEQILSPQLTRALDYINSHLFEIDSVYDVAEALYISPSSLFHMFRNTLHQSPKKYINDKRLLAAQRRIAAGELPTAVYKECGFREYASFYRSYCAFFGHAPSKDKSII